MTVEYTPHGVCSRKITIEIDENNIVTSVNFLGGCNGNLQGISALAVGKSADELIEKLSDIKCGMKDTSCPAQFAEALRSAEL
ncbi:MAG: TIGR03905 family TSCPD domain-containing protein [Oscillospiraceae bacterium]|jgi:uncharacterized protein (TIGR03905 family)